MNNTTYFIFVIVLLFIGVLSHLFFLYVFLFFIHALCIIFTSSKSMFELFLMVFLYKLNGLNFFFAFFLYFYIYFFIVLFIFILLHFFCNLLNTFLLEKINLNSFPVRNPYFFFNFFH